ncbi:MAG: hypothetical protein IT335_02455 [Thermomicrobiales bacterium]|nr:hypothetical protein [Thermomicrobiales bacterium]
MKSVIRLGVVGHRLDKLSHTDLQALREPVRQVLDHLQALSPDDGLEIITSLAEGADRLVAEEALSRNLAITVVLPFDTDAFRLECSDDASRSELDAFIARAKEVIEPASDSIPGESGYYWASMLIVQSSDVLIAVWDGEPGRGPGGTAGTIDEALIANIPVVWVRSHPPYSIDIVDPPNGRPAGDLHRVLATLESTRAVAD